MRDNHGYRATAAWAGAVWGYALFWFLVEDRIKLAADRWLGHHPRHAAAAAVQPS